MQASARAFVSFWDMGNRPSGKSQGRWYWCGAGLSWQWGDTLEACVEAIRARGFGAYTYEGKTIRLRSRYVAGDRPPP